jgi:hypothetical protein
MVVFPEAGGWLFIDMDLQVSGRIRIIGRVSDGANGANTNPERPSSSLAERRVATGPLFCAISVALLCSGNRKYA